MTPSINTDSLARKLHIQTASGKEAWEEGFSAWPRTTPEFAARAGRAAALKRAIAETPAEFPSSQDFRRVAELEDIIQPLLRPETSVESESYSQVCWRGSPWAQLNSIPLALFVLAFYKSWCLPALTILMPLFIVIASYILMIQMMPAVGNRLSLTQFLSLVWSMWSGNVGGGAPFSMMTSMRPADTDTLSAATGGSLDALKKMAQMGAMAFTIGQTLWTPIQQAMHFQKLDADCRSIGDALLELEQKGLMWSQSCGKWTAQWCSDWFSAAKDEMGDDARRAFAFCIETPYWLRHALRWFGILEVQCCIARHEETLPVRVLKGPTPTFQHSALYDPALPLTQAVKSNISLGGGGEDAQPQHAILTGPNRGGKSSSLRAILTAVYMAHAYGVVFCAPGGVCAMSRFSWIADGLRLEDAPGKTSMFEREVAFARSCMEPHRGHGFLVYDECFHSTNPTDSERTSTLFCSRLWRDARCISIVSTHLYSLAEKAPASVKKLCVPAVRRRGAQFEFSYRLEEGVCKVSSVDGLLNQYGFFPAVTQDSRKAESKENPAVNKNEHIE